MGPHAKPSVAIAHPASGQKAPGPHAVLRFGQDSGFFLIMRQPVHHAFDPRSQRVHQNTAPGPAAVQLGQDGGFGGLIQDRFFCVDVPTADREACALVREVGRNGELLEPVPVGQGDGPGVPPGPGLGVQRVPFDPQFGVDRPDAVVQEVQVGPVDLGQDPVDRAVDVDVGCKAVLGLDVGDQGGGVDLIEGAGPGRPAQVLKPVLRLDHDFRRPVVRVARLDRHDPPGEQLDAGAIGTGSDGEAHPEIEDLAVEVDETGRTACRAPVGEDGFTARASVDGLLNHEFQQIAAETADFLAFDEKLRARRNEPDLAARVVFHA